MDGGDGMGGAEAVGGRLVRYQRGLARRHGEQLYAELAGARAGAGVGAGKRSRGSASVVAYGIACLVHGVTLALLVAGVLFVVLGLGRSRIPLVVAGVVMLALVTLLRPRFRGLERDATTLRREQAPVLFGLLDEIAGDVGARSVDVVQIDAEFNASVFAYGIRRRRCLCLGLGLWQVLTPEQRVAVLAHEFGHFVNGDVREGLVVSSALRSLHAWIYVLTPVRAPVAGDPDGLLVAAGHAIARAAMVLPRVMAMGVAMLLAQQTFRARQRAEYLADDLAARVASGPVAVAALERLLLAESVDRELLRQVNSAGVGGGSAGHREVERHLWDRLTAYAAAVPDHEFARLRQVGELRGHAVDETHPPTHLRIARLESAPERHARIAFGEAEAKAVERELGEAKSALAREVVRDYAYRQR